MLGQASLSNTKNADLAVPFRRLHKMLHYFTFVPKFSIQSFNKVGLLIKTFCFIKALMIFLFLE